MNEKIIIFSAPSGSGKTTILKRLIQSDLQLEFSISATSREQRNDEVNGKDYYFFTSQQFNEEIKKGSFLEWQEVYKNQFYGTLLSEIDRLHAQKKNVVFDVDVLGGLNIKKYYGSNALALFILPPSLDVLRERLIKRGTETEESLEKRLKKAVYEISFKDQFDVVLVNDQLESTVDKAYEIVSAFLNSKL
ncbi:MAG: guanylate kinase [Bacteroidales bacterium]|nr:guanylate kinase [Bacteroidales bacterium]